MIDNLTLTSRYEPASDRYITGTGKAVPKPVKQHPPRMVREGATPRRSFFYCRAVTRRPGYWYNKIKIILQVGRITM